MNLRQVVVLGLLFVTIGFLVVVNMQQGPAPHPGESWLQQAFWPAKSAWWSKTGMWAGVALMGYFFRRWKRE
jgi:hypothetical protein